MYFCLYDKSTSKSEMLGLHILWLFLLLTNGLKKLIYLKCLTDEDIVILIFNTVQTQWTIRYILLNQRKLLTQIHLLLLKACDFGIFWVYGFLNDLNSFIFGDKLEKYIVFFGFKCFDFEIYLTFWRNVCRKGWLLINESESFWRALFYLFYSLIYKW